MNTIPTARQIKQLREENKRWPLILKQVQRKDWPSNFTDSGQQEVWRSRDFLVQVFAPKDGAQRISICRTEVSGSTWRDGISWDEIQRLKAECGFGNLWACELYPPDYDLVNVENMRHIWLIPAPEFGWKK